MKVQDLTRDLKFRHSRRPHVRSNASILHFKDNIYYMVYRLWVLHRGNVGGRGDTPLPWKHTFHASEYTGTVFTVLRRTKSGSFVVVSEKIVNTKRDKENIDIEDARLLRMPNGSIGLSFNTYARQPDTDGWRRELIEDCTGEEHGCTLMALSKLNVKHKSATISKPSFPCNNLKRTYPILNGGRCFEGQREEKNWLFFKVPGSSKLHVQYFFEPLQIFKLDLKSQNCSAIKTISNPYIAKLKKELQIKFLGGAPPIRYSKHEFLGIGHLKYDRMKTKFLPNSVLRNKVLHYDKSCNPRKIGRLIYLSFFYTFKTGGKFEVLRLGNPFVPPKHGKSLLSFPMGITKVPKSDDFVVSYGEQDSFVKLLTCKTSEIENMLRPVKHWTPENYKPLVF